MTTTIPLPDGVTLRTDSSKFFHVVKVCGLTAIRLASRDDLWPAVNAFYSRRTEAGPDATVLLVDADGTVLRPLPTMGRTG